jgi:hypothetical protein
MNFLFHSLHNNYHTIYNTDCYLVFCCRRDKNYLPAMAAAYILDPANAEVVEVAKDAEGTVQYIGKPPIISLTAQERVDAVDFLAKQPGRLRLSAAATRVEFTNFENIGEDEDQSGLAEHLGALWSANDALVNRGFWRSQVTTTGGLKNIGSIALR